METKPKVLKWALVIGIVVVLNLFLNYSISLFYKEPDYNTFFPQQQVIEPINTKADCLAVGGQWNANVPTYKNVPTDITTPQLGNYCDPNFTKQQEFNDAQKVYQRNIFIMLVVLGVISLLLGVFLVNEILTLGLSWGGVLSLLIASMRYWSTADNLIKVLILGFALGALIWLSIKKFSKTV
jgi:hypothetical protein